MWRAGALIMGLISVIGIYSFSVAWVEVYRNFSFTDFSRLFFYGFAAGFAFWIFLGRFLRFFQNFEHELTHLLVGLLFFKRPRAIFASEDEGGLVSLYGGNFIITLAPYFLPTFSLLILPFFLLFQATYHSYLYVILGFLTGYHVISTFEEFNFRQPDIQVSGRLFSIVFCLLGNIVMLGFVFAFAKDGFPAGWEFLKSACNIGVATVSTLLSEIRKYLDK
jgi:hypothetical protein